MDYECTMEGFRKEPRDGGADVPAVFAAGLSGYYPAPYLTSDDLLKLSSLCRKADRVIAFIEAYEITLEHDVPRLDLGLYGETTDQKLKSWSERAEDSHTFVCDLLTVVKGEPNPIMFGVWLDWGDEALSS